MVASTLPALSIGPIALDTPVVLAPMAGITNTAFRRLCREYGAGLYVSEMITTRALVERTPESMRLISHHPSEALRSVQLYGVDPKTVEQAVAILVDEDRADHIDLNFGCPVPKVTRRGGGSALPWKRELFAAIVQRAVQRAGDIPVTVKMRKGIDDAHLTYLDAGRIAEDVGVAAVALHGRTAAQHYSGQADWDAIGELVEHVDIPVLGNGDIWEAADALRMVEQTGAAGVVVGRGCLGRPWLFRDLADVFAGREPSNPPRLGEVADIMLRHARALADWTAEAPAMRAFRRHASWYTKGFRGSAKARARLMHVERLSELAEIQVEHLDGINENVQFKLPDELRGHAA